MNTSRRAKLIPYAVTTVIAALMAFGVYLTRGVTDASTDADRYRALCDSFTVPGVLLLAFGALLWVAGEGALVGVTWLVKNAILMLIPGKALDRVSYAEYLAEHQAKKKGPHVCIFVVGAVFVLIAVVFLMLYNNAA
ncbi:MAG: DUF3899 domain-containing protein [Lachnospiraceae bacterium]|nr:DUF3899 domain-containing protein [Lachnospiraceae bacterium]